VKLFKLAVIALILGTPAQATPTTEEQLISYCASVGTLAKSIMQRRQEGVAMSVLLGLTAEGMDDQSRHLLNTLVIRAFEQPQWHTPELQNDTANRYGNDVEADCIRVNLPAVSG
jgi:hypothetical protein